VTLAPTLTTSMGRTPLRKRKNLCHFWLEMKLFGGLEISMQDKTIMKLISLTSLKTSKKLPLSKRNRRWKYLLSIHSEILWFHRIASNDSMNLLNFMQIIQLQHSASRQGYSLISNRITWIRRFNLVPMLRSRFHFRNTERVRDMSERSVWKGYQNDLYILELIQFKKNGGFLSR